MAIGWMLQSTKHPLYLSSVQILTTRSPLVVVLVLPLVEWMGCWTSCISKEVLHSSLAVSLLDRRA